MNSSIPRHGEGSLVFVNGAWSEPDSSMYGDAIRGANVLDEVKKKQLRIQKARAKHDVEVAKYLAESDMTDEEKEFYLKVIAGMDR
jgi:hypothetical protein